jgi:hypothetical protein
MAGILRHFFIASVLSLLLFFFLKGDIQIFQLFIFIIGNLVPDLVFIPYFVLKYKTFDPEKLIRKREWKFLCNRDEIIVLVFSVFLCVLFYSYETLIFLFGVIVHIIIDIFVNEVNVWW